MSKEPKWIVITGTSGYVGSHVASRFRSAGFRVAGIDCVENLRVKLDDFFHSGTADVESLSNFIVEKDPEAVIHIASIFFRKDTPSEVRNLVENNVGFGTQVLDACRRTRAKCFVNTGSYWQYRDNAGYSPVDLYAATKAILQLMVDSYVSLYNIRATTLVLFDPYGKDDLRPKFLPSLIKSYHDGLTIKMTPGEQVVDFVHIDDIAEAYLSAVNNMAANNFSGHQVFGVSSGHRYVLRQLIERVCAAIPGLTVQIGALSYRPGEVMLPWSGFSKVPNWMPTHDVFLDLMEWLSDH